MLFESRSAGIHPRVKIIAVIRIWEQIIVLHRPFQILLFQFRNKIRWRRIQKLNVGLIVFVDIIDNFVCLAESFFGVLEMKVAAPREDDVVALMDFEVVGVKPVDEVLHFLFGVEGAESGVVIYEIIT